MITRVRVAHALLILAGLLVMLYPLTIGASPDLTCRGVQMQPGDQCAKADGESFQTYEERSRSAASAKPIIIVVGGLVAAFGALLLVQDVRRTGRPARGDAGSSDLGVTGRAA